MSGTGDGPDERSKAEIEADLAQTREHLADTVDALGRKVDVKTRSREATSEVIEKHGRTLAWGAGAAAVLTAVVLVLRRRRH